MAQLFPRRANQLPALTLVGALFGGAAVIGLAWYFLSPEFYEVGFMPRQPVPYSHELHVGQLGMDCRYCHAGVEGTQFATIPSTQTCMTCHNQIRSESIRLLPVRESWATGRPIDWVKVNHLPDYARFSHAIHVNVGVGCESCHGRIDQMEVVWQVSPMSMSWCLDCHRTPEEHLRDPALVTQMGYLDEMKRDRDTYRAFIDRNLQRIVSENIRPPENCSSCHY
jgi:hypothetical protein